MGTDQSRMQARWRCASIVLLGVALVATVFLTHESTSLLSTERHVFTDAEAWGPIGAAACGLALAVAAASRPFRRRALLWAAPFAVLSAGFFIVVAVAAATSSKQGDPLGAGLALGVAVFFGVLALVIARRFALLRFFLALTLSVFVGFLVANACDAHTRGEVTWLIAIPAWMAGTAVAVVITRAIPDWPRIRAHRAVTASIEPR